MAITVYTNLDIETFTMELGYSLHNIAIISAPMDTGNLRRAIGLTTNTDKRKVITYNAFDAYYLDYLEKGLGPVKKYKGFISEMTISYFLNELVDYFVSGEITNGSKATITLERSKHGAMFSEKAFLKQMGYEDMNVTADDRRKLSQIYYRSKVGSNRTTSSLKGRPNVERLYKRSENKHMNLFYTGERIY